MPEDALDQVLRLVAEGRLTAAEAAPILDALEARSIDADDETSPRAAGFSFEQTTAGASKLSSDDAPARAIRIVVSDDGRNVVNLRVPLALGRAALDSIPGLSEATTERIRAALASGFKGPLVQVDDDGDGVRIAIE
jgi:hypothetical protein